MGDIINISSNDEEEGAEYKVKHKKQWVIQVQCKSICWQMFFRKCQTCKPKVFSCKFCKILKHVFFQGRPLVAASKKPKAEAVIRRSSVKKVFFKTLLNSQENTCARVSFL